MSVKISEVISLMERLAPNNLALEYDNIGLILGDPESNASRVLVALDLDDDTAQQAIDLKADLVITHHPTIFKPIKKITTQAPLGRRIILMIKNGVSVYAGHTNLDIARMGTNNALFDVLELTEPGQLIPVEGNDAESLGRTGLLDHELSLVDFCCFVKEKLGLKTINFVGNPEARVRRIGLCTGSASDVKYLREAVGKGCDVYITGDVTYHNAQAAREMGLALIDGTHFATEVIIVPRLVEYLSGELANRDVEIYAAKSQSVLSCV